MAMSEMSQEILKRGTRKNGKARIWCFDITENL